MFRLWGVFNLPFELWVCKSCEHQFQLHQAVVENIYSYRLNETMREKIEKAVLYTEPLAEFFRKKGLHVKCFSQLLPTEVRSLLLRRMLTLPILSSSRSR